MSNPTKFKPIVSMILIKVDKLEEKSEGGIILSTGEDFKREANQHDVATIIEMGDDAFLDWEVKPKVGTKILYSTFAGFRKEVDGEVYRFISDSDIFAIEGSSNG